MAIRINFDGNHNAETPTLVLGKRNGDKIGLISNIDNINLKDCMNYVPEMSFTVHKYVNGVLCPLWDEIKDFRLIWCKEWDMWFQLTIDINISDETIKNVSLIRLAEAELSQTNLYGVEINTETDISRDDYTEPTILYNPENTSASLLHRIMEKVPHYSLRHVDITLAKLQRTFEFDDIAITDALQEIAEEINALVVYHSNTMTDGKIARQISLYDLESNCLDCGHRGEFTSVCPECGSTNIDEGYGEDTTIFVDEDNILGTDITLEVDTDSVKNCFRLVTGDELLTATVVNCNPNGSGYLWYFSDDVKNEMSEELRNKINAYDDKYKEYQTTYQADISGDTLTEYNNLVTKYQAYNQELEFITSPIVGYSNVMNSYYNTIDLNLFLNSGLNPVPIATGDAISQMALLNSANLSPIAINDINNLTKSVADSSVLGIAKLLIHPQFKVSIVDSSLSGTTWTGNFKIVNRNDEEDSYIGNNVSVSINDDYLVFVNQKLDKILGDYNEQFDMSITALFGHDLDKFKAELKGYSLNGLVALHDGCQSCLDIMIEQGLSDKDNEFYSDMYIPYYKRLMALEDEIEVREKEVELVLKLQDSIIEIKNYIQDELNFEKYLGTDLWYEFCSFRREDTYENDNYISDGLNNAELFKKALEFIEVASKDIYKSANLQHKITATLKNLLTIKEFAPLVKYFSCGNWLRIKIDEKIYKLRLLEYSINFDNLGEIDVEFSDVVNGADGISDTKSILEQASSIATSYDSVKRQASQGADGFVRLDDWVKKGLDATTVNIVNRGENQTQSWDSHGMLYRQYDDITETYLDTQLKIINCGLYITDDNWESTRTGIGRFTYFDPKDKEYKEGYGVVADTICSNIVLSEEVGIYNANSSIVIDKDGIKVDSTDGTANVTIDANTGKLTCEGAFVQGDIIATSLQLVGNLEDENGNKIDFVTSDNVGNIVSGQISTQLGNYIPFGETSGSDNDGSYSFNVSKKGLLQAENAWIQGTLYSSDVISGTIYTSKLVGCEIDVTTGIVFLNKDKIIGSIYKIMGDKFVGTSCDTCSKASTCSYINSGTEYNCPDYEEYWTEDINGDLWFDTTAYEIKTDDGEYIRTPVTDNINLNLRSGNCLNLFGDLSTWIQSGYDLTIFKDDGDYFSENTLSGNMVIDARNGINPYDVQSIFVNRGLMDSDEEPTFTRFEYILSQLSETDRQAISDEILNLDYYPGYITMNGEYIETDARFYCYAVYDHEADRSGTTSGLMLHQNSYGVQLGNAYDVTLIKGTSVRLIANGQNFNATNGSNIRLDYVSGSGYFFRPYTNDVTYLGSSGYYWKALYATTVNATTVDTTYVDASSISTSTLTASNSITTKTLTASGTSNLSTTYHSGTCYFGTGDYFCTTNGNSVFNVVRVDESFKSSGYMRFYCNTESTYTGHQVFIFREQSGEHRTIFRPETDESAYLGSSGYRWNTVFSSNGVKTTSDLKLKNVISNFDFKAKDFIMSLNPIAYTRIGQYSNGVRIHLGLGAQTLHQNIKDNNLGDLAMTSAVIMNEDGTESPYYGESIDDSKLSWTINYNELIAPMIKLLQEQQVEIDNLKSELNNLKG